MENRVLTMVVVAALAVVLGVGIVAKQNKDPLLKELLTNQSTILQGQLKLEDKLSSGSGGPDTGKIAALEVRVAALEGKLAGLEAALKARPQAAAPTPQRPPQEDFNREYDIPIAHSYVKGNKNAKVTITEFVDFECPFCARFHEPINEVLEAYPNDVKVVIKNFPLSFHKNARPAAKAAFAAGIQGKYFEMAEKLLANQRALTEENFEAWAKELGLNVKKFKNDYSEQDAKWEDLINKDFGLGQNVGVRGTPTFYINGKKTRARDLGSYKREIDAILKK